jgi:hypothetical protein
VWESSRPAEADRRPRVPREGEGPRHFRYVCIQSSFQGPSRADRTLRARSVLVFLLREAAPCGALLLSAGAETYASVVLPSTSFLAFVTGAYYTRNDERASRTNLALPGAAVGAVFREAAIYVMAGAIVNCFFRLSLLQTQLAQGLSPARCPKAAVRREGALSTPRVRDCQRAFSRVLDKHQSR